MDKKYIGEYQYLVMIENDDGERFAKLVNAGELFYRMDMADCTGENVLRLYDVTGTDPILCTFRGCWHDLDDPLKMAIFKDGKVVAVGYGTDH